MIRFILVFVCFLFIQENFIDGINPIFQSELHPMIKTDEDSSEDFYEITRNEEEEEKLQDIIRVPYNSPQPSQQVKNWKKILMIKDGIRKEFTKVQIKWIDRFVISLNHWLKMLSLILDTSIFKKYYAMWMQESFDLWITGRKDYPFQMSYKEKNTSRIQTWNIILHMISIDGLGLGNINLKSIEIYFVRSQQKMEMPNGQMAYRKDRVYDLEVELKIPSSRTRIKYEILRKGEQSSYDTEILEKLQDMKLGYMRLKLSHIHIYAKIILTEIDKRFVTSNPNKKNEEKYYFMPPEIVDFRFTVEEIKRYNITFQKKPGYEDDKLGDHLNVGKARKIITDFTNMLSSKEFNNELNNRIKVALMDRFSRAIMTVPDILYIPMYVDEEASFYKTDYPLSEEILSKFFSIEDAGVAFYMCYSWESFLSGAWSFLLKGWDNMNDDELDDAFEEGEDFMEEQREKSEETLGVGDNGFDYEEDKKIEIYENLIQRGIKKQQAEKMAIAEYEKIIKEKEEKRAEAIKARKVKRAEMKKIKAEEKRLEKEEEKRLEKEEKERQRQQEKEREARLQREKRREQERLEERRKAEKQRQEAERIAREERQFIEKERMREIKGQERIEKEREQELITRKQVEEREMQEEQRIAKENDGGDTVVPESVGEPKLKKKRRKKVKTDNSNLSEDGGDIGERVN